jgi:hypothetical protein
MSGRQGIPERFIEQVTLGLVPGVTQFRKFGMNSSVPSGTDEMWSQGAVRTLPGAAAVVVTSSDSIEDDPDKGGEVPGTGAFTLRIEGLDANYLEITEDITLNGTANVNTTQSFLRVNRAYCLTAGTGEINAGNITGTIGGNAQYFIEAGQGQTHQTHYTVPANKYLVVTGYYVGVGRMGGSTDMHILGQVKLDGQSAWRSLTDIFLWDGGRHHNENSATLVPPKTEIRQRIISTATTQAHGIIAGYLVETNALTGMK